MLTWHNVWMAGHGRQMAREMRDVGAQVAAGERTLAALAIVVGVAVLREGSEVVLFLYGIASQPGTTTSSGDSASTQKMSGQSMHANPKPAEQASQAPTKEQKIEQP